RVKDGKSEPPPPGWERVEKSTLALAMDIRDKKWLHVFPRTPGPHIPIARSAFLQNVDDIILGLETGPTTRFHLIWFSPNQLMARKARASSLTPLLFNIDPAFGEVPDPEWTISPAAEAVWDLVENLICGKASPTALGSEFVGTVPDDLIHFMLRMVDGDPSIAKELLLLRSELAGAKGQYDRVIAFVNDVIRADPRESEALGIRGAAYCAKGSIEQGLADLNESIRLNPRNARVLFARAQALCRKRDYEKAMADLNAVIRHDPRHVDGLVYRGCLLTLKGDFAKAAQDLNAAIAIDPSFAAAYGYRAEVHCRMRDWDRSIADYSAALRLCPEPGPDCIKLYLARSKSRRYKGDIDGAIADCSEAIRIDPGNGLAYLARACHWESKGEYQKALDDLDRALLKKSDDQRALIA